MNSIIQKAEDGTITLTITIPADLVKKTREAMVEEMAKQADVPGFRKGKAPTKLVAEKLAPERVREETLRKLLPQGYMEAVKQHNIHPIMNPKIQVKKLDDEHDWEFMAITCESPIVELKDYRKAIQNVTAKSKIIVPGKEPEQPKLDDIVKSLMEVVSIKIPQVLIEAEVDRLLAQTLDEIKRLGLSLEQYLSTTNRNADDLRKEYAQKAEADIKFEFTLQKISEVENITVDGKEIEEAIHKAQDDKERQHLEQNRYLLANIIRQQKTLDFIKNL